MSELDPEHQNATNAVLVGCLTRLGWTPEQFAAHLNRLARSLRPAVPDIHPKTPWHGHSGLTQASQTDPPDPTMLVPSDNFSKLTVPVLTCQRPGTSLPDGRPASSH